MPMGPCPGPGRGGRHPVPAVVGADGAAGAGGRVFGCPPHRCPPTVSAAAPGEGGGAQGARDPPRHLSLSPLAAFQGPAAQPRAQLRVHLRQRAQRGARPLQVWGRGLGDAELEGVPGTSNPPLLLPSPSNTTRRKLSVDEMYLADTGGQYLCVSHPLPPSHPAPSPVGFGAHVPPSAGMAPRTSHGPCTGARRPRCRRCWHHGAVPATELGLWPEAGCVEGGDGDIPSAPRSAPSPCHL